MKASKLILMLSALLIATASKGQSVTKESLCDSAISVCPNTIDYLISRDILYKECSQENYLLNKHIANDSYIIVQKDSIISTQAHTIYTGRAYFEVERIKDISQDALIKHQEKIIARKTTIEIILGVFALTFGVITVK